MTKIYHTDWGGNRQIYTEANKPNIEGLIEHELKNHEFGEKIQSFAGWTPHYQFEEAGFKLEKKVDLLRIGKPVKRIKNGAFQVNVEGVIEITPEDEQYGRANAGTKGILRTPENKLLLRNEYERLNNSQIPFVVFRTYRGWPAIWDSVYFFSQGEFKP